MCDFILDWFLNDQHLNKQTAEHTKMTNLYKHTSWHLTCQSETVKIYNNVTRRWQALLLVAFDRLFIKCMNIKRRISSNSVSEVCVRASSIQVNDNKSIHWMVFGVWDEYKILVRCPDQWTNSAVRAKWMLVESELSAVSWPLEKRNGPRQNGNQIEAFGQTN